MCTAILYKSKDAYFGRNLDLERGYGECVVITPRCYEFKLRHTQSITSHYAMIGMATVVNDFPLYFEATNEKGLSVAGLNFPENAVYFEYDDKKDNIAPFEFIPWILCQCCCVDDAKQLLDRMNLTNTNFNKQLPLSPLHWIVSDKWHSIVAESLKDGLKIYDNPFEILTNNPTFDYHKTNLCNYMGLSKGPANTHFKEQLPLYNYSLGMGAIGLPGDFSSASRFVRAFFVKENSVSGDDEKSSVNQFFHILNSVAMPKGCVAANGSFEYTRYSSCCNTDKGIYYYTTYNNLEIASVSIQDANLNSTNLCTYSVKGLD